MLYVVSVFVLPPLLIFGIYHLALWFDLFGMTRMVFWRRVAVASALAHVLLAAGFFVFSYLDYRANRSLIAPGQGFDSFLFNRSEFWRVMFFFDIVPTVVLLGFFGALDRLGIAFGPIVPATVAIVLAVGTLQWYWVGGGIGAVLERLWSGLKSGDDDLPDWL